MAESATALHRPIKVVAVREAACLPERVRGSAEPLVLKDLVAGWPLVQAGKRSTAAADTYLRGFCGDATVGAFVGDPSIQGRFFYNDDGSQPLSPP